MTNVYWEKEEFEDLVARSIVSLHEKEIQKECLKVPKFIKPNEKDIDELKKFGVYFPPEDRITSSFDVDMINDGLPKEASWGYDPNESYNNQKKNDLLMGEYFRLFYIKLMPNAPTSILDKNGFKYFGNNKVYKFLAFSSTEYKGFHLMKSYFYVTPDGKIFDTYARRNDGKLIITSHSSFGDDMTSDIGAGAVTIGLFQDRKYLWNVCANDGTAKATFGVYPEQIKSLFYSRELPLTETGRKRPILHWVASHHRRIKSGIDIDIKKHLRGCNEFIYQGTKFTITNPLKKSIIKEI